MTLAPTVDDLRLVIAIHRHGSIGAAARELLISQPSASTRLAALERRLELQLFERDTTGARATAAGTTFVEEASHVLGHLEVLPHRVRAGSRAPLLRVATFPSLAAALFPALDETLNRSEDPVAVHQYVDHGDVLVGLVAEGSLDVAVIAIADQMALPPLVTTTRLGSDRLVALTAPGTPLGRRKRPFDGVIPYHCVDLSGPAIERRIAELGGQPRRCATGEVAVLTARATGQPALVAGCIAPLYRAGEESVSPAPFATTFTFRLVTRTPAPPIAVALAAPLATRMGLARRAS